MGFDAGISNNKDWYRFAGPLVVFLRRRLGILYTDNMFLFLQMGVLQNFMIYDIVVVG